MKTILLTMTFIMCGCSSSKFDKNELVFNDTIKTILQQYIDEHPQYNTFLLRQSDPERFCSTYFPRGFLLGPGYQYIIEREDNCLFVQIGDARVYIENYINKILNCEYGEIWENTNPQDTVIINNKIETYPWHKYIYKAIFIYYVGDNIIVNARPDTIFMPERVESEIKFVPIRSN